MQFNLWFHFLEIPIIMYNFGLGFCVWSAHTVCNHHSEGKLFLSDKNLNLKDIERKEPKLLDVAKY